MTVFRILTYPHVLLKKKSSPVKNFTADLKIFTDSMLETMHEFDGIGLAAPQVGIARQILVLDLSPYQNSEEYKDLLKKSFVICGEESVEIDKEIVVINPQITKAELEISFNADGCLSFPGASGFVTKRFLKVEISAQNLEGKDIKIIAEGITSVALQHEIDHLNGILFVDRLVNKDQLEDVLDDMHAEEESPIFRKKLKKLRPKEARDYKWEFL